MDADSIASLIKARRKRVGLTLTELGESVGCTHAHLSNIEHGKATPSPELRDRLAAALGIAARSLRLPRESDTFPLRETEWADPEPDAHLAMQKRKARWADREVTDVQIVGHFEPDGKLDLTWKFDGVLPLQGRILSRIEHREYTTIGDFKVILPESRCSSSRQTCPTPWPRRIVASYRSSESSSAASTRATTARAPT